MNRYHIGNATHFAEFHHTPAGLVQARAFRKKHQIFKRRRIRSVLQLCPDMVPVGTILEYT